MVGQFSIFLKKSWLVFLNCFLWNYMNSSCKNWMSQTLAGNQFLLIFGQKSLQNLAFYIYFFLKVLLFNFPQDSLIVESLWYLTSHAKLYNWQSCKLWVIIQDYLDRSDCRIFENLISQEWVKIWNLFFVCG